jgi:hypothetical protein
MLMCNPAVNGRKRVTVTRTSGRYVLLRRVDFHITWEGLTAILGKNRDVDDEKKLQLLPVSR